MSDVLLELFEFLGITLTTPENFQEFMPWFLTILVSIGFVFAVFGLIGKMCIALCDRKYF